MRKLLLALAFALAPSLTWAQNPTCPTRPVGDATNACASTAFVSTAVSSGIALTQNQFLVGNASNLGQGRLIVGSDLPLPSTTTLGGVFSAPATATSALSGISNAGAPQQVTVNGTSGLVLFSGAGSHYNILYSDNGRDAINLGDAANTSSTNLHKAATHSFNSVAGTQFAQIDSTGETITTQNANALAVGRLGSTTPAFQVDSSAALSVTGIKLASAADAGAGSTFVTMTAQGASAVSWQFQVPTALDLFRFEAVNDKMFEIRGEASPTSYLVAKNAAAATVSGPILMVAGTGNANMSHITLGTGALLLQTGGDGTGNVGIIQAAISHTASANRYVNLTGSNGGNPAISAGGGGLVTINGALPVIATDTNTVTNAMLSNMANSTIKCRTTAGTGAPEDCTASQVRSILSASYILEQDATQVCHTGDLVDTTLKTIAVAGNLLGINGGLRITVVWSRNSSGTASVTINTKFGGTLWNTQSPTTTALSARSQTQLQNRGAANSQVGTGTAQVNWGTNTAAIVTAAIDTTTSQNILLTGQLSNTGDSVCVESYTVEVLPSP